MKTGVTRAGLSTSSFRRLVFTFISTALPSPQHDAAGPSEAIVDPVVDPSKASRINEAWPDPFTLAFLSAAAFFTSQQVGIGLAYIVGATAVTSATNVVPYFQLLTLLSALGLAAVSKLSFIVYPRFHLKLYAPKKVCVRYSGPPY